MNSADLGLQFTWYVLRIQCELMLTSAGSSTRARMSFGLSSFQTPIPRLRISDYATDTDGAAAASTPVIHKSTLPDLSYCATKEQRQIAVTVLFAFRWESFSHGLQGLQPYSSTPPGCLAITDPATDRSCRCRSLRADSTQFYQPISSADGVDVPRD